MLRQERFGGGSADQKNMDAEFARQVMTDGGFKVFASSAFAGADLTNAARMIWIT
jgi:hypothetical protein